MGFKLVFAGTPQFAAEILNGLLKSEHEILAVFTQPDRPQGRGQKLTPSPVKELAISQGIPGIPVYQPLNLKSADDQALLQASKPDLLIVAAYGLILPKAVLTIPKLGCINVHASLLPRWRGAAPIQHALMAGDKQTGITIMQMDAGLDTGDVLAEFPCNILSDETGASLTLRLAKLGSEALLVTLKDLAENKIIRIPQAEMTEETPACYASKIAKNDAKIDWQESSEIIERKIRAFNAWPIAFSSIAFSNVDEKDEKMVRVWEASVVSAEAVKASPGTIIAANTAGLDVATGLGVLRILKLQLAGGKPMEIASLLTSKQDLFKVGGLFR